nr:putative ribonuclease H-like domain-containing protein [Tanacetum cinerariifolium]
MRPFGCPVTILNTIDPLRKFDGKADEGFLVGYSVNSKAFRVFNSRTSIVQETLHINFLENKPNVVGIGPKWLFDIDTLTKSMNYQPVVAAIQPNHNVGIQENLNTDADVADAAFDDKEYKNEVHDSPSGSDKTKKHNEKAKRDAKGKSPVDLSTGVKDLRADFEEFSSNSTNRVNAVSAHNDGKSSFVDPSKYPDDPDMPALEDIVYSDDEDNVGVEADPSNLEPNISVSPIPTTKVHKDHLVNQIIGYLNSAPQTKSMARMGHTQEKGIDYKEVFAPVARIEAMQLFLAYASFMGFMVYQMDVKSAFPYRTIEEEVYVYQPPRFKDLDYPDKVYKVVKALYGFHQALRAWYETLANYLLENGFQRGKIDQTLFIKKQKGDILLVQVYVDDIIFGSTNKELCKAFEKLMMDKFQMSSIEELTFFLGLQTVVATSSTEAEYVAVASCCAQYQIDAEDGIRVTASNLKLLLSGILLLLLVTKLTMAPLTFGDTHNMVAYVSKSDTSAGFDQIVKFLNAHAIQKKVVVTEDVIRQDLHLDVADGVECLPNEEFFVELAHMSYEKPPPNTKRTMWNEFSCSMASAVICLAIEQDKHTQALKIIKLKKRVKKLEKKKSRSSGLKRLRKVDTSHRVKSSTDTVIGAQEDASKQGGIEAINSDEDITLVDVETQVDMDAELQERIDQDTLIKMKTEKTKLLDEQMAQRLHDEEVEKAAAWEKQEKDDLESATTISMTYDKVRPIFKREYKKVQTLFKPDKNVEEPRKKRVAEETLLQESFKKLKGVEVSCSDSTQETLTNDPKEMSEEDV